MMSQLEIHLPENWPPAPQDEAGSTAAKTAISWLVRGTQGNAIRSGEGALGTLPAADGCHIVLPAGRVLLSSVRPPAQNRKKFMQALPYALEDRLMADPESVHVAPGPQLENGEMPVAIVDRAWLRQALDTLRGAGLTPLRAETETLLAPWQEGEWSLVWRGNGGFLRSGPYSGMPLDGGNTQEPPPGLQLALQEAVNKPASIQIHCDGGSIPDTANWTADLGIPVTLVPHPPGERNWQLPAGRTINLLQGEFGPAKANRDWLPRLRPALILVGVLVALHIVFNLVEWGMLRYEKQKLTRSMEQIFLTAFPDAKVIVDAPLQMSRNLADLRHLAGQLDQDDFLPLLAKVTPLLGNEARLRGMEYRQGTLTISLTLANSAAADTLRASLESALPQARLQAGNPGPSGLEAQLTIGK